MFRLVLQDGSRTTTTAVVLWELDQMRRAGGDQVAVAWLKAQGHSQLHSMWIVNWLVALMGAAASN